MPISYSRIKRKHQRKEKQMSIIEKIKKEQMGFITLEQLEVLVEEKPHVQVLVRCGNGRFVTPAQNVKWFCDIINKEGTDYVRDISLLMRTV